MIIISGGKPKSFLDLQPGDIIWRLELIERKATKLVVASFERDSALKESYLLTFYTPILESSKIQELIKKGENSTLPIVRVIIPGRARPWSIVAPLKIPIGIVPCIITTDLPTKIRELGLNPNLLTENIHDGQTEA